MCDNSNIDLDAVINKISDILDEANNKIISDVYLNSAAVLQIETIMGLYVINKQSYRQEIWLSSPVSGPYHFAYINNAWQTSNGHHMQDILTKELGVEIQI